jgi:hypothetical protein
MAPSDPAIFSCLFFLFFSHEKNKKSTTTTPHVVFSFFLLGAGRTISRVQRLVTMRITLSGVRERERLGWYNRSLTKHSSFNHHHHHHLLVKISPKMFVFNFSRILFLALFNSFTKETFLHVSLAQTHVEILKTFMLKTDR